MKSTKLDSFISVTVIYNLRTYICAHITYILATYVATHNYCHLNYVATCIQNVTIIFYFANNLWQLCGYVAMYVNL